MKERRIHNEYGGQNTILKKSKWNAINKCGIALICLDELFENSSYGASKIRS